MTAFSTERLKGLSGMPGNWHVSFLGGWAGVISSGYPVGDGDIISLPDTIFFVESWRVPGHVDKTLKNPF